MNIIFNIFSGGVLGILMKFVFVFVILVHVAILLIVIKQIHQADRVSSLFTHKLLELIGYINIVILILIVLLIALPI